MQVETPERHCRGRMNAGQWDGPSRGTRIHRSSSAASNSSNGSHTSDGWLYPPHQRSSQARYFSEHGQAAGPLPPGPALPAMAESSTPVTAASRIPTTVHGVSYSGSSSSGSIASGSPQPQSQVHDSGLDKDATRNPMDTPFRLTIGFCGSNRWVKCEISPQNLAKLFHVAVLIAAVLGGFIGVHFKEVFLPNIMQAAAAMKRNWQSLSDAAGRWVDDYEKALDETNSDNVWAKFTVSLLFLWPVVALIVIILLIRVRLESEQTLSMKQPSKVGTVPNSEPSQELERNASTNAPEDATEVTRPRSATIQILSALPLPNPAAATSLLSAIPSLAPSSLTSSASLPLPIPPTSRSELATVSTQVTNPLYPYQQGQHYGDVVGHHIVNRFSVATLDTVEGSDVDVESNTGSGAGVSEPPNYWDQDTYDPYRELLYGTSGQGPSLPTPAYASFPNTTTNEHRSPTRQQHPGSNVNNTCAASDDFEHPQYPNPYQSVPLMIPPVYFSSPDR